MSYWRCIISHGCRIAGNLFLIFGNLSESLAYQQAKPCLMRDYKVSRCMDNPIIVDKMVMEAINGNGLFFCQWLRLYDFVIVRLVFILKVLKF